MSTETAAGQLTNGRAAQINTISNFTPEGFESEMIPRSNPQRLPNVESGPEGGNLHASHLDLTHSARGYTHQFFRLVRFVPPEAKPKRRNE